jgi:hypothetical protein
VQVRVSWESGSRAGRREERASGWLVSPDVVVTAAHGVRPEATDAGLAWRRSQVEAVGFPGGSRWSRSAEVVLCSAPADLAVLRLAEPVAGEWPEVRFGAAVASRTDPRPCGATGFPRFKRRPESVPVYRDRHTVNGHVEVGAGVRSGDPTIVVEDAPAATDARQPSPWEGMSGAAVLGEDGALLGLVTEHHPDEGSARLTMSSVSGWYGRLSDAELAQARQLLGLPEALVELPPQLSRYLAAVQDAARRHPYPGVLPSGGRTLPWLGEVYLRQEARQGLPSSGEDSTPGRGVELVEAGPRRGQEVLAGSERCVVIAGPGGGKSSLLRCYTAEMARQCQGGQPDVGLPVLVSAADLAERRPLPVLLAQSVTRALSVHGQVRELDPGFFEQAPWGGGRWQVLVDGLDEVTDPATRADIVNTIVTARGVDQRPYRFVITTRPLPGELDRLGEDVPRYHLEPFAVDDLHELARRWFAVCEVPEGEQEAAQFVRGVYERGILEMARIPLMATMLCQLYASYPGRPLPGSRGELYRRFVDLLRERFRAGDHTGINAQVERDLQGWEPGEQDHARGVLGHLPDLIARWAAHQHAGGTRSAVDFLLTQPGSQRPRSGPLGGISEDRWRDFLRACLLRTGVLVERADRIAFLHHTFLEYFATRTLHDPVSEVCTRIQAQEQPQKGSQPRRARNRFKDSSYLGFLLDDPAVATSSEVEQRLVSLAGAGIEGCTFIIELRRYGCPLTDRVVDTATATLDAIISEHDRGNLERVDAAVRLTELAPERGEGYLDGFARDSALPGQYRVAAGEGLAGVAPESGRTLLTWLARDSDLDAWHRVLAAEELAGVEPEAGRELLVSLIRDPYLPGRHRVQAAVHLRDLVPGDGREYLESLARSPALTIQSRTLAAMELAEERLESPEWRERFYLGPGPDTWPHSQDVVSSLVGLGAGLGEELLASLAKNASVNSQLRLRAAKGLAGMEPETGRKLLVRLAQDNRLDAWDRWDAARMVADVTPGGGGKLVASLTRDRRLGGGAGRQAGRQAETRRRRPGQLDRDPRQTGQAEEKLTVRRPTVEGEQMASLALNPWRDPQERVQAAEELAKRAGLPSGVVRELLMGSADDATLDGFDRIFEVVKLAGLAPQVVRKLLMGFAIDSTHNGIDRVHAAGELAGLAPASGRESLALLARDSGLDGWCRVQAARTLVRLAPETGQELLRSLANDTRLRSDARAWASRKLAELDD